RRELARPGPFYDALRRSSSIVPGRLPRSGCPFSARATAAGVVVGQDLRPGEARPRQERGLRMWSGDEERRAHSVQIAVLPLRDHLPDLRCGTDFPLAVRGGLPTTDARRVRGHDGVPAAAGGGAGLGLGQGGVKLEVRLARRPSELFMNLKFGGPSSTGP